MSSETVEPNKRVTRRAFSIAEKFDIISRLELGLSQSELCTTMNLRKSTVSSIWKNKDKIKNEWQKSGKVKKKMRLSTHNKIDQMLFEWYDKKIDEYPINGPMLQRKAEKFGKLVGDEFKCSSGWVDRFKKRHNIKFNTRKRKVEEVISEEEWIRDVWPELHGGYNNDNIFTIEQIFFYYKEVEDKLEITENCFNDEYRTDYSMEYISIVVSANATGTEKRNIIIVAKFKDVDAPPYVDYIKRPKNEKKTSPTGPVLLKWDEELKNLKHKRKIKLLVDTLDIRSLKSTYPTNISIVRLSIDICPGPTSMNKAIAWSFKDNFKKLLKSAEKNLFSIQEFIEMAHKSWHQIPGERIYDCFQLTGLLRFRPQNLGFWPSDTEYVSSADEDEYDMEQDMPLHDWLVIKQATESSKVGDTKENGNCEMTKSDALDCLEKVRNYFQTIATAPESVFSNINQLTKVLQTSDDQ